MKYRKKPVVIEAFRYGHDEAPIWLSNHQNVQFCSTGTGQAPTTYWVEIKTLEGVMVAKEGEYIIRGVAGEIYPCKPEIFEQTYEPVTEDGHGKPNTDH